MRHKIIESIFNKKKLGQLKQLNYKDVDSLIGDGVAQAYHTELWQYHKDDYHFAQNALVNNTYKLQIRDYSDSMVISWDYEYAVDSEFNEKGYESYYAIAAIITDLNFKVIDFSTGV